MPQASFVWLGRAVAIALFLLLVLFSGPRAGAAEIQRLDAAWILIADGTAKPATP